MPSSNLKNKSVLFYDHGTFVSLAERLAKDFGEVKYYSPWKSSFPKKGLTLIGDGLPGVIRVNEFFDHIDDADLIVFPDVSDGDLQLYLESKGKLVWGSRKGEEMELDRIMMKEYAKKLGLPIGHYEVVKGLKELRNYLKTHENIWVKINVYRGDFETFYSKNYKYIESKLNELDKNMGPLGDITEFICEDELPPEEHVELAYDGYTVDGQYPKSTLAGIEIKDLGYIGVHKKYEELPNAVKKYNEKMVSALKGYRYRNFFHPEMRIDKKGIGYMIDPACRCGSPPNEVYQELFTNISDIIWQGAHGICVDPIAQGKYAVEIIIHSTHAQRNWMNVQFSEKYKDNLKWRNVTVINKNYQIVPQYVELPEIGAVIATGDSIEEAINLIHEVCDDVDGFYLETPRESLDKAEKEIQKLKDFGIDLFS